MTGLLDFSWWVYAVLSITVFLSCLSFNFVLKLYNDSRLDARSVRMHNRNPVSQATQVNRPSIEIETRNVPKLPVVSKKDTHQLTQKHSLKISRDGQESIRVTNDITLKNEDNTTAIEKLNAISPVKPDVINATIDVVSVKSSFLGTIYGKDASETMKVDTENNVDNNREGNVQSDMVDTDNIDSTLDDTKTLKSFITLKNCDTPRHDSITICSVTTKCAEENCSSDNQNIVEKIVSSILTKVYESKTVISIASLQNIISQKDDTKAESIVTINGENLDFDNQNSVMDKTTTNAREANVVLSRTSIKKSNIQQSDNSIH